MPPAEIEILPIHRSADIKTFIRVANRLYRNDPRWIAPLEIERREFLNPKKNPFFQHATVQLFLAKRDGTPVGRISAHIDYLHEPIHGEKVGYFGFFECEDDPEVARALLNAAENFLRGHGCEKIRGPFSFSINHESGLLVEGFDEPMMTMTPYNPQFYAQRIEACGYAKAKDLYAWRYFAGPILEGPLQVAEAVEQLPQLKIRNFNPRNALEDTKILFEVFNSAWSGNWSFVPMTEAEIKLTATELRWFADPRYIFIAEVDGKPAGICLTMPNVYELFANLRGKLFPFGFLKLIYRLKRARWKTARLMLLGIKKEFRGSALGGLSVLLYVKLAQIGTALGASYGELSWTLEDNEKINAGIEFMGGKIIKRFRIYEKALG